MIQPVEASTFLGVNWDDLFRAFLVFLGTYFGSKHGTNGGGSGGSTHS